MSNDADSTTERGVLSGKFWAAHGAMIIGASVLAVTTGISLHGGIDAAVEYAIS